MNRKRYTEKDRAFLEKYYKEKGGKWCAEKLKTTLCSVHYIVSKWKIKRQLYYKNIEGVFNRNNLTSDIVYILGNSIADVTLQNQSKNIGHRYVLKYDVSGERGQYKDNYALLKFIREHISPERPIKKYRRWNKKYQKHYKKLLLNICGLSKEMVVDLKYWGIIENRTSKEFLPLIPGEYFYVWLRGLFDGDGSIGVYKDKRWNSYHKTWYICSPSELFLSAVQTRYSSLVKSEQLIGNIIKKERSKSKRKKKNGENLKDMFVWEICNKSQISQVARFMYQDDGFCFQRKKNRFIKNGLL